MILPHAHLGREVRGAAIAPGSVKLVIFIYKQNDWRPGRHAGPALCIIR